jgi:hypothetical protein
MRPVERRHARPVSRDLRSLATVANGHGATHGDGRRGRNLSMGRRSASAGLRSIRRDNNVDRSSIHRSEVGKRILEALCRWAVAHSRSELEGAGSTRKGRTHSNRKLLLVRHQART